MTAADSARSIPADDSTALRLETASMSTLGSALDATDVGVLVLDSQGSIQQFTEPCRRFLGVTGADVGRRYGLIETSFDRGPFDDAIVGALETGAASRFQITSTDALPTDALPTHLLVSVAPITGGEIGDGVAISLIDIAAAAPQRELERTAEPLAQALNESGVVLWEQTIDMEPVWASDNFAEIVGFSETDWHNFPHIDNIHPDDVPLLEHHLAGRKAEIRSTGAAPACEIDYRYRTSDGTYRTVNARTLTAEHDGRTVIRGRNIDVTDERAREAGHTARNEELDRLNRSLSGFTQMVSHDLRAPLRHVVAIAGFIREDIDEPLPEPVDLRLAQIEERVRAMSRLIDDLLEYTRSGTLRTEAELADIDELIAEATALVDTRDGIDVTIRSEAGVITTQMVPLSVCVRNLVDNAIKHHPGPKGSVEVSAWLDDGDLRLTVSDDGEGIDPVHHHRIFEPMQSLEHGTGLGLASVKKILDERRGSIDLDSAPGQGATFTIAWPLDVDVTGG